MEPLLTFTPSGIHCPQADVYIDPWRGVERAIVTHAHSDHARRGSRHYLAHPITKDLMHARIGAELDIQPLQVGKTVHINGVGFSLHPAGHIPGSVQVRVEHQGQVWVASGDHKREPDGISEPFAAVPCHAFITESTFGLPIYDWEPGHVVLERINRWWARNAAEGVCSVISAYSLGKAQRVIRGLDASIGPILVHGAVANMNTVLAGHGMQLPPWRKVDADTTAQDFRTAMVVTPGSAIGTPWTRRMRPYRSAIASGWMQLRGWRRRSNVDQGFVLSDHADWKDLLLAVKETGAERIIATHGYTTTFSRYLREQGLDARAEQTEYTGEQASDEAATETAEPPAA